MSKLGGLGVVAYCTPEGGSGYVTNSNLPWLSDFDWQQMVPKWDQTTEWMRNSKPGTFSNYPRWGPPYSLDGGTLPPYAGGPAANASPTPYDTSCGMGDLVLLREDVIAPMPSITNTARTGCFVQPQCPSALAGWIQNNPWLAVGLAAVGGYLLFGGKR